MKVVLMRHGDAIGGGDDFLRTLSDVGVKEVKIVASELASLGFEIDRLVSSPLLRAKQTANHIEEKISSNPERLISNFLTPNSDTTFWQRELSLSQESIMLVGHLPFMGILAGQLLGMPMISFNTADALILEREGNGYTLLRHISCRR